jgi:hypothetical protein
MKVLTLIYAYYDNPGMLARQIVEWSNYSSQAKASLGFIVVDDGSPGTPAASVFAAAERTGLSFAVYRVAIDKPWGQDAARNIGMNNVETEWALMTDMDHMVTRFQAEKLVWFASQTARRGHYYMPARSLVKNGEAYHPHPNSFVFHRRDFWDMGGYDEDFVGFYGSDGNFRKCAKGWGLKETPTTDFKLVLYGSNDQEDANTKRYSRKDGPLWAANNLALDKKRRGPAYTAVNPLRQSYVRVL